MTAELEVSAIVVVSHKVEVAELGQWLERSRQSEMAQKISLSAGWLRTAQPIHNFPLGISPCCFHDSATMLRKTRFVVPKSQAVDLGERFQISRRRRRRRIILMLKENVFKLAAGHLCRLLNSEERAGKFAESSNCSEDQ